MKKWCFNKSEVFLVNNTRLLDKINLTKIKLTLKKIIASKEEENNINNLLWNLDFLYNNHINDRNQLLSFLERIEFLEKSIFNINSRELYQNISEYVGVLNSGLIASELYLNNINENNFDKVVNTRSKIEEKRLQFIKSDRRSFKNAW